MCFGCYCHHHHPAAEKGCKHGSSSLPCFLPCYRKQQKLFLWWYTPVPPFPISLPEKKGNENRVLSSLFLSRVFFLLFSVIFSQSGVPHPCFCVFHKKRKKRDTCTHGSFPSVIKARSLSSEIFYTSRKKGENRVCALVGTFKTWIPSSKTLQQAPFSFYLFLFPFLSFFATCNLFPLSSPLPFFCQFLLRETNVGVRNYLDSLQSLFHK